MMKKASIFLLDSKKNSSAFELLLSEVKNAFGEPAVMDFDAPSEFAQAAAQMQSEITVAAVSKDLFLKAKFVLLKLLNLKISRSNMIIAAMGENAPENEKERDLFAAIPSGAKVYPSIDGLFSAFSLQTGRGKLIFLPLDENILKKILPTALTVENRLAGFKKNITAAINSGKKIAVAPCGSFKAIMNVISSVEGYERCFTLAYGSAQEQNGAGAAEILARSANVSKENTSSDFGAAMSTILTDYESGEKYVFVCLADSDRARVVKLYSESGENEKQLAAAAVIKLCEMIEETTAAGALIRPEEKPEKHKKVSVLPVIIAAIGILAAIVFCVVAMFAMRSDAVNEKTQAMMSARMTTALATDGAIKAVKP